MSRPLVPDSAQPCLWMSAGLLSYKLCDRDFQCDSCPLDVGLRGVSGRASSHTLQTTGCAARGFPGDRCYTQSHAWVQPVGADEPCRWRFGLDAFAAAIVGHCGDIVWHDSPGPMDAGDPVCEIDFGLGRITIGAPLPCQKIEVNQALLVHPERLVTEPYEEGWIAALTLPENDLADGLLQADEAQKRARLDLQWFRRQVALRLLGEGDKNGGDAVGEIRQSSDFREILAGPTYQKLLPELVH
jgi:glycine cleavage system H lipoate-binding protein